MALCGCSVQAVEEGSARVSPDVDLCLNLTTALCGCSVQLVEEESARVSPDGARTNNKTNTNKNNNKT